MAGKKDIVEQALKLVMGGADEIPAFKMPTIRPSTDNLMDVGSSNFDHFEFGGDKMLPIQNLVGGVNLSDPSQRKRVDALKSAISNPDTGYISRLVVDQDGNVIEGQHRLEALRESGATEVPVTILRDKTAGIDVPKIKSAITSQGSIHSDHVNQLIDMLMDADQYDPPSGFEKFWDAGLKELSSQKGRTGYGPGGVIDDIVEMAGKIVSGADEPAATGIRAYHGSPKKGLTRLSTRYAVETPNAVFAAKNPDVAHTFTIPREYGEPVYVDEFGNDIEPGEVFELNLTPKSVISVSPEEAQKFIDDTAFQTEFVKNARQKGHDLVVAPDVLEGIGERSRGDVYAVLDDRIISIIRKYGIAGASAMLGYNLMDGLDSKQALAATMADQDYQESRQKKAEGGGAKDEDPYAEEIATAKALMAAKAYEDQPWSEWAGDVAKNAVNTAKAILPTVLGGEGRIGISDIARGAYEAGKDAVMFPGDVISGKQALFDKSGKPLESAVGRSFNAAATIGGAAAPIPRPSNSLGVFGGIKSLTADKPALRDAMVMESKGANPEDVYGKTGWFRGADNNWRYEIPDIGSTVDSSKFQLDLSLPTISPSRKAALSEYLQHPEFFAAYPQFKNMDVVTFSGGPTNLGSYFPRYVGPTGAIDPHIEINENLLSSGNQQRSTLLHEIQHAIQQKEGFAPGTNVISQSAGRINPAYKRYEEAVRNDPEMSELMSLRSSIEYKDQMSKSNALFRNKYGPKLKEIQSRDLPLEEEDAAYKAVLKEYKDEEANLFPLLGVVENLYTNVANKNIPLNKPKQYFSPAEAYEHFAGEVEARNVQNRRNFPKDYLRETTPWATQDYKNIDQLLPENDFTWKFGYSDGGEVYDDDDINDALRIAKDNGGVTDSEFMSEAVKADQKERRDYSGFVNSQADGDWARGAAMYRKMYNRPADDIFNERQTINQHTVRNYDTSKFNDKDWENYWLLSQHADMYPDFQKKALENIGKYRGTDNDQYRYLSDRISCSTEGSQKYGTQQICAPRTGKSDGGGAGSVFMTDAKGIDYDAQGNIIPPETTGPNPQRSNTDMNATYRALEAANPVVKEKSDHKVWQSFTPEARAEFSQQYPSYAAEMRKQDVAASKKQVQAMPEDLRSMTHTLSPIQTSTGVGKVEMPLFGINYEFPAVEKSDYITGETYRPAESTLQSLYDFKTVPFYYFPLTAGPAAAIDVAEGVASGDPTTASLAVLFGPGGKYSKAAGIAGINYLMDPANAQAGPSKLIANAIDMAKAGIRAFHGSPHDFPPVRLIEMPDGTKLYQNMLENMDTPEGAKILKEYPLGRFDMSKIGTGEGAQAYGHGFYFAESEPVAQSYRDALSPKKVAIDGQMVDSTTFFKAARRSPSVDDNIAMLNKKRENILKDQAAYTSDSELGDFVSELYDQQLKDVDNEIAELSQHKGKWFGTRPGGSMYEVNIDADPNAFLDWDKPLSEHPQDVRDALQKYYGFSYPSKEQQGWTGKDVARFSTMQPEHMKRFYEETKIPGIKYLDAGSRGTAATTQSHVDYLKKQLAVNEQSTLKAQANRYTPPDYLKQLEAERNDLTAQIDKLSKETSPTRNYVVFDDNLISIIRKYGIAGASVMAGYDLMKNLGPDQAKAAIAADQEYQADKKKKDRGGTVTGPHSYDNDSSVAHALALTSEY